MSFVTTKAKFHVALDGVGLLLQGAPDRPAYKMDNAPVYGTRFASGDRDYNDLSQWWYLVQTDWSGGIKDTVSFADDAQFYYSSNIDARTKPGTIRLEKQITLVYDNTAASDKINDISVQIRDGNQYTHFMDVGNVRTTGGTAAFDDDGSPTCQLSHKGHLWIFGTRIANTTAAVPYPFITSDKTAQVNSVITGSIGTLGDTQACIVGSTLYVAVVNDADSVCIVKTDVANPTAAGDWTLVKEFPVGNSLGASIMGLIQLSGQLLILVEGSPVWTLSSLDIASGVVTKIKDFQGGVQNGIYTAGGKYLQRFFNTILITVLTGGSSDEDGEIWVYDGSTITLLYESDEAKKAFSTREAKPYLKMGCTVYDNFAFWGNLVYDGTHLFNFIKDINDSALYTSIPVGEDGTYLYLVSNEVISGDDNIKLYKYDKTGTSYKDGANNEAFLVLGQHDKLQSIDKLLNTITIGFEKFLSGQEINIYYSTNPIPDPNITTGSWTLLGSATYALDGGNVNSKVLYFPVGTTAKKLWFRVELVSGGSNTPGLTDLTLEYLPMPDYKKQWMLNINAGDEVRRMDGSLVETTGRELKSRLERSWWTKSQLDFQDVDYATSLLNGAISSVTATTITIDSAYDFPEQGRIRIDDEEILYTAKTDVAFTGCTRGARGTRAATHADNAVVNNAYKVIITDIGARAPTLLGDKEVEYTVNISLRET